MKKWMTSKKIRFLQNRLKNDPLGLNPRSNNKIKRYILKSSVLEKIYNRVKSWIIVHLLFFLKIHNRYYHTNICSMYYVLLFSLHARSYAEVSSMTFPFPGLGYGNFFLGKCTGTQFRKLSNFVSNLVLFGWCRLHKRKKNQTWSRP